MMHDSEQYPFIPADSTLGEASLQPYLPLTLIYQGRSVRKSDGALFSIACACYTTSSPLAAKCSGEGMLSPCI